jgi:hypothetical protein
MCSGHSKCVGDLCARLPHAGHGRAGRRSLSCPTSSQSVQIVSSISGQLFLLCPFGSSAPLHFVHLCSGHSKLLAFRCVYAAACFAFAYANSFRWTFARRMASCSACCTLGTDTNLFSGDAQIARIAYSSSCTLSCLYGAIQIHS